MALQNFIPLISGKKKKVFVAAPIHLTLQHHGWEEPKIVQRAWLVQIMLTLFGVWLAMMLDEILRAFIFIYRWQSGNWRHKNLIK